MTERTGFFRRVGDKMSAGVRDRLRKSVYKATNHDMVTPKEKHVQLMLETTRGNLDNFTSQNVYEGISQRLTEDEALCVLKALICVHRLLREGDSSFARIFSNNLQILVTLSKFSDTSDEVAFVMSPIIRSFSEYLVVKLTTFKKFKKFYENQTDKDHYRRADLMELVKEIPVLQSQFLAACEVNISEESLENPVILSLFKFLFKDILNLFLMILSGIKRMLDSFFTFDISSAEKALELYEGYEKAFNRYETFVKKAEIYDEVEIKIDRLPLNLYDTLKDHVQNLKDGTVQPQVSNSPKQDNFFEPKPKEEVKGTDADFFNVGAGAAKENDLFFNSTVNSAPVTTVSPEKGSSIDDFFQTKKKSEPENHEASDFFNQRVRSSSITSGTTAPISSFFESKPKVEPIPEDDFFASTHVSAVPSSAPQPQPQPQPQPVKKDLNSILGFLNESPEKVKPQISLQLHDTPTSKPVKKFSPFIEATPDSSNKQRKENSPPRPRASSTGFKKTLDLSQFGL
ncbi:hypothetical protein PCE1_000643 [Barthelona sp. PCE]